MYIFIFLWHFRKYRFDGCRLEEQLAKVERKIEESSGQTKELLGHGVSLMLSGSGKQLADKE